MRLIKINEETYVNVDNIMSITNGKVGLGGEEGVWVETLDGDYVNSDRTLAQLVDEINNY